MKKTLVFFSAMLITVLLTATNLTVDPPSTIMKAFKQKYPSAVDIGWDQEGTVFTADFEDSDGFYKRAFYDGKGNWIKTEIEISEMDIPNNVLASLVSIKEVEYFPLATQVEEPTKSYYVLGFEDGDNFLTVTLSEDGKILNKEAKPLEVDEEDEDDDGF